MTRVRLGQAVLLITIPAFMTLHPLIKPPRHYRIVTPHLSMIQNLYLKLAPTAPACGMTAAQASPDMPPPPTCNGTYPKPLEPCPYNTNCTDWFCEQGTKKTLCASMHGTSPCTQCYVADLIRCQ